MRGFRSPRFVALPMLLLLCGALSAQAAHHEVEQKVVVHLSHFTDDLHAVSMALAIGTNLQQGGAAVTVFLDLEGARLADARAAGDHRWGGGPSISERFDAFVKAGGSVVVCSHCAEAAGLDASRLRKGARIGSDAEVRKLFLGADKILDY